MQEDSIIFPEFFKHEAWNDLVQILDNEGTKNDQFFSLL